MQTFIRKTDSIYKLTFDDKTIVETTWSHPFFIKDKEWVMAKDLRPGMRSMLAGDFSKRESQFAFAIANASSNAASLMGPMNYTEPGLGIARIDVIKKEETVYNFEVENNHTYFVTEDEVLVHNAENNSYNLTQGFRPTMKLAKETEALLKAAYTIGENPDEVIANLEKSGKYSTEEINQLRTRLNIYCRKRIPLRKKKTRILPKCFHVRRNAFSEGRPNSAR